MQKIFWVLFFPKRKINYKFQIEVIVSVQYKWVRK